MTGLLRQLLLHTLCALQWSRTLNFKCQSVKFNNQIKQLQFLYNPLSRETAGKPTASKLFPLNK